MNWRREIWLHPDEPLSLAPAPLSHQQRLAESLSLTEGGPRGPGERCGMGTWLYEDTLSLGPAQGGACPGWGPLSCARQAPRRSRRSIFILAPAVMGPASPALGAPWSGTQPGSVFNSGSVVAD